MSINSLGPSWTTKLEMNISSINTHMVTWMSYWLAVSAALSLAELSISSLYMDLFDFFKFLLPRGLLF